MGYQLIPQEHRHRVDLADQALRFLYESGSPLVGRLVLSIAADGPDNIKAIAQRIGVPTTSAWAAVRSVSLGRIRNGKVIPPRAKLLCITRSGDGNGRFVYLTPQGNDLARALAGL
ncbi:hypothetical protein [Synechococcus sp. HK01-R]|uniref:hypothetical protein n=1 Tax=Synechococcus sp. HK01-R TaxID=2751171 RepID=UPI00162359E9|nr:hypothetical protein [Synechococcus sp. HK01-R]QNG26072.1 hypothetical protein H0O21_07070 [Synechococcus sp. HK01-R]